MSANSSSHDWAFLRGFLARPWKVASPIPSGRKLARRVAQQIDAEPGGLVVELGPGTGAVTRAICARGIAEEDLLLIESDPEFVTLLRAAYPRARVVQGDAFDFVGWIGDDGRGVRTIISGLPVVGEPAERKRRFLESAIDALASEKPFVQFSYSSTPPLPRIDGVKISRVATVWENIWPMRIWIYRRTRTPND